MTGRRHGIPGQRGPMQTRVGLAVDVPAADRPDATPTVPMGLLTPLASTARTRAWFTAVRAWLGELRDPGPGPVKRADRAAWAATASLADLGELTAQWLEGRVSSQPGYYGSVDVDEDLAPGLTAALIACNRAGYWTRSSQAGFDGPGYGGHWEQLAWVCGFIDRDNPLVGQLVAAACAAGYEATVWVPAFPRRTVTWWNERPHTGDSWMPARVVRREVCDGLSEQTVRRVLDAAQVSVIDPVPGRNTLWALLEQTARGLGGDRP